MKAFTAAELASLSLPAMPTDTSAIIRRAKREHWQGQPRAARGGGTEYPAPLLMKVLPAPAKEALLQHLSAASPLPAITSMPQVAANDLQPTQIDASRLADWQRNCADARAAILNDLTQIIELIGVDAAIKKMISMVDAATAKPEILALVPVANARAGKDGSRTLSYRTLYRWRADYALRGWDGLVPLDNAKPKAVPAWAAPLLQLYRVPTKRSLAAILDDLKQKLPAEVTPPSYDAARRFLASMSVVDRERGRHGPGSLLKFKSFKRRSTDGLSPLDVVTADGHTFKADVAHPIHGKPFRPEVCAILDVATRFVFGWSAGLAESSFVVMDAIRHGISSLGLFAIFYTDNGAGYVAKAMTDQVIGLLGRIGATPKNSIPGRAQARGKIERLQGTLWKQSARKMITYNGRDMDNEARRKVIKLVDGDIKQSGQSRFLMSWQDFLSWCQAEVDAYNSRPHRGLPKIRDQQTGIMRHMTPHECLQQHIDDGWQPETVSPAVMTDLFRPVLRRVVQRGEISLPWGRYFHQDLVPFGGETVRVGYDIHDGSQVWVRTDTDGRLICVARKDGNVIAEQPASAIDHAKRKRAEAKLKLAERDRELALAELGPRMIDLYADRPTTPEQAERFAALEAEFEQHGTLIAATPSTDYDETDDMKRFRRAINIRLSMQKGEAIAEDDWAWFNSYRNSSEFKGKFALYEEYGEQMLA